MCLHSKGYKFVSAFGWVFFNKNAFYVKQMISDWMRRRIRCLRDQQLPAQSAREAAVPAGHLLNQTANQNAATAAANHLKL